MNPSVGTTAGGVETSIRQLARVLASRHEVWILTGRSGFRPRLHVAPHGSVKTVTVAYWPRFSPPNRLATSVLRRLNPYHIESLTFFFAFLLNPIARRLLASADVISTHSRADSELFSWWASRRNVACVFHVQGTDLGGWFRLLDRSTRYVSVSEDARSFLEAKTGLQMQATVSPGVPEELLGIPREEENVILFVGRLQPSKRADWAIRIFSEISREFPTYTLEIVGDGPARQNLERQVRDLSLAGRIRFRGELLQEEVWRSYARAKVLLMPSTLETYALVPLEAMAAGCPVIASDIETLRLTAAAAVFAPPNDTRAWVDALADLLLSEEKRRRQAEEGRRFAAEHGWRKAAEAYERELVIARRQAISTS